MNKKVLDILAYLISLERLVGAQYPVLALHSS
jgi:hypothetical protein